MIIITCNELNADWARDDAFSSKAPSPILTLDQVLYIWRLRPQRHESSDGRSVTYLPQTINKDPDLNYKKNEGLHFEFHFIVYIDVSYFQIIWN